MPRSGLCRTANPDILPEAVQAGICVAAWSTLSPSDCLWEQTKGRCAWPVGTLRSSSPQSAILTATIFTPAFELARPKMMTSGLGAISAVAH